MTIKTKYFYFRLNEWHHLYTGAILVWASLQREFLLHAGNTLGMKAVIISVILWTFGWALVIDDLGQHILQGIKGKDYHSPMHYAGKPLYILRKLLIKKFPALEPIDKL